MHDRPVLRLYESGKFQEAVPYFDQVLARHNRDLEILIKRGSCYLRMNQPLKALDDFDRVNHYSLRHRGLAFPESWGHRGVALLMLGRDEEALESFRTSTYLWNLPGNQPWNVASQAPSEVTPK